MGVAHVAGGELGRPQFQRLLIDPDADLAPVEPWFRHRFEKPWRGSLGAAMLAGVPLAFALDLDARAVDQKM
jgi:hypothetical protein